MAAPCSAATCSLRQAQGRRAWTPRSSGTRAPPSPSGGRRFLSSDERGSIVSVTDSAGTLLGTNTYDEYGQPAATNLGTFGYTGQAWLPTIGMWYYKARVYSSSGIGFMQPDPLGYADSPNLYAYVLNDPVNNTDPLGLCEIQIGTRICAFKTKDGNPAPAPSPLGSPGAGVSSGGSTGSGYWSCTNCGDPAQSGPNGEIIVTAPQWEFVLLPTGESPFYFNGKRFESDPLYRKPWYSNTVDRAVGCLAVCPLAAAGAWIGTAEGGATLAGRMVLSDKWGVFSDKFGTSVFRSTFGERAGSWNTGFFRTGWSFDQATGRLFFQLPFGEGVDTIHVWSPLRTYVPGFLL